MVRNGSQWVRNRMQRPQHGGVASCDERKTRSLEKHSRLSGQARRAAQFTALCTRRHTSAQPCPTRAVCCRLLLFGFTYHEP